jgi:hypothetical protein
MSAGRSRIGGGSRRARTTKNAPSRSAPSSGFPIDLRRSGCRSGDHQPPVLRSRCTRESRGPDALRQVSPDEKTRNLRSFAFSSGFHRIRRSRRAPNAQHSPSNYGTTKKCTGAVAPSSGFLTDLRRSGCRSGDHQPQALLPRCNHQSRGSVPGGQAGSESKFPQFANFASNAARHCASRMML